MVGKLPPLSNIKARANIIDKNCFGYKIYSMNINLIKFDCLQSTNDYIKQNYNNLESGTLIIANEQTNGRGRLGRNFYSPKNGLYFSLLIKNIELEKIENITPIIAVSTMCAIKEFTGLQTEIKWVNDLLLSDKKVCGILCESKLSRRTAEYCIAGVGINIRLPENGFPHEIQPYAGALFDHGKELPKDFNEKLALNIAIRTLDFIDDYKNKSFLNEYREHFYLSGKKITIKRGEEYIDGIVKGVNDSCNIILSTIDGEKTILSGNAEKVYDYD